MHFKHAVVLTGGIATGKSTIAQKFLDDGFHVIDADRVAHEMLERHRDKIAELFGEMYVVNGVVDRKALGSLIFTNEQEKLRLEKLLHPLIFDEITKQAREQEELNKTYLIDIPLFFESRRYAIEQSIVVYTPEEIQLKRLIKRDNLTLKEAQQRIEAQLSIEKKKQLATYVIDNSKEFNHLQQEYDRVKKEIDILQN